MEENKIGFAKDDRNMELQDLGLYIHVPFCARKCHYCDFLSGPANETTIQKYFHALYKEIESYQGKTEDYLVKTVFFGGGTPSLVNASYIKEVMLRLREYFRFDQDNPEITLEINPGTITRDKLLLYRDLGINRLSFGLQSTNNQDLKLLGRIHSFEEFLENYQLARELGFKNINIDLISAIPGQTLESWEKTLEEVLGLNPEHISAYSLIIEENTPFYDLYSPGSPNEKELPGEDIDRQIYSKTKELMQEHSYQRYEISNYAKAGYECRHNISYWTGKDYLGLGLGSASLINGARFSNMHDLAQYIENCAKLEKEQNQKSNLSQGEKPLQKPSIKNHPIQIRRDYIELTKNQQMEEFMFLGLRMCHLGIRKQKFQEQFQLDIHEVYGNVLHKLISNYLLEEEGDRIRLTDYGIDISNGVLAEFLLD